jgi:hypothetical protein
MYFRQLVACVASTARHTRTETNVTTHTGMSRSAYLIIKKHLLLTTFAVDYSLHQYFQIPRDLFNPSFTAIKLALLALNCCADILAVFVIFKYLSIQIGNSSF